MFLAWPFLILTITGDQLVHEKSTGNTTITGTKENPAKAVDPEKQQTLLADTLKSRTENGHISDVWGIGSIDFETPEFKVKADEGHFQPQKHQIALKGNVEIQHKGHIARGSDAVINLKTNTYTLNQASGVMKEEETSKKAGKTVQPSILSKKP